MCQPAIMFEPDDASEQDLAHLERIYRRAPVGALTIAGIATAIVFGLWLAFYWVIFLPRGVFP
jgi:Na+/alanine symporter